MIVHSSLSKCGYFPGGPGQVITALREVTATLAMPVFPNVWGGSASTKAEPFDPRSTASYLGIVGDTFWRQPDVVRSRHPTHSIAVCGTSKNKLIQEHETHVEPCGIGTPYHRIVQWNGSALLFGVDFNSYTLFHTAEAECKVPYLYYEEPMDLYFLDKEQKRRQLKVRRQDMSVTRRFAEVGRDLVARGLASEIHLGSGMLTFIPSVTEVHSFVVERLRKDPYYLTSK